MKLHFRHMVMAFPVFLSGVLSVISCSKDERTISGPAANGHADVVTFDISLPGTWTPDTRSASSSSTEPVLMNNTLGDGSDMQIYMYMIEENIPASVSTREVVTRADGDAADASLRDGIGIYGYQLTSAEYAPDAEGASLYMENIDLSTYGDEDHPENPYYYWPGPGTWFKFFAYAPYADEEESVFTVAHAGDGNMQPIFSYKVPGSTAQDGGVLADQLDIMVGTHAELIEGDITDEEFRVEVMLQHILSQVVVKAGTLAEGRISSIQFVNLHDQGTYLPSDGGWTLASESVAGYAQTLVDPENSQSGKELGTPMYLMPQKFDSNTPAIIIGMEVTSPDPNNPNNNEAYRTNEYEFSLPLKTFTDSWTPGKKYTYVITTPQEVEVEVTDKVEGNVKSDLVIRNTGLAPAYIRVAIIGSWVIPNETETYDDDIVIADWTENDGEFAGFNSADWVRLADGYYYHRAKVPHGDAASTLFDSYTLTSAPVAGAVLDLTIVAQAVLVSDADLAWPLFKDIKK